jgi:hypothetical protein
MSLLDQTVIDSCELGAQHELDALRSELALTHEAYRSAMDRAYLAEKELASANARIATDQKHWAAEVKDLKIEIKDMHDRATHYALEFEKAARRVGKLERLGDAMYAEAERSTRAFDAWRKARSKS